MELLDMTMLDELRVLGADDLRDLIGLYFTDVQTQLARAHNGLDEGDGDTVAAAAHRLKGASLSIGAARVATLAADLEVAGRQGELENCGEMLAILEGELDPTKLALNAELSAGSVGCASRPRALPRQRSGATAPPIDLGGLDDAHRPLFTTQR